MATAKQDKSGNISFIDVNSATDASSESAMSAMSSITANKSRVIHCGDGAVEVFGDEQPAASNQSASCHV